MMDDTPTCCAIGIMAAILHRQTIEGQPVYESGRPGGDAIRRHTAEAVALYREVERQLDAEVERQLEKGR